MLILRKPFTHCHERDIIFWHMLVIKCSLLEKVQNKPETLASITIALYHHDESTPSFPFKVYFGRGEGAEAYESWREVSVFDIWFSTIHNRHNTLESRSLSGKRDSDKSVLRNS